MSAAHITYAEKMSLHDARKDFRSHPSAATANALLAAAYEVWNESHLDERDYVLEVETVRHWLAGVADRVHLDCKTLRETLAFGMEARS